MPGNVLRPHLMPILSSASSTSDLSFIAGNQSKDVSGMPDPLDVKSAIEVSLGAQGGCRDLQVLSMPYSMYRTAKHNTEIEAEARRSRIPLSWSRRRGVTQGRSGRFDAIYAKTQPRRHRCLVVVRRRWAHLAASLHHKYATHLAIM